jgi:thiamine biosynthesis lipoprotein ApbE
MPTTTRRQHHRRTADERGLATADWPALGTTAQVVTDPAALDQARAEVATILDRLDLAASRFRADSELSRINASGGEWVDVSPMLARALAVALDAAAWTRGLVDPTVGARLVDLGYDRTFRCLPSDGPRVDLGVRRVPGWESVDLDLAALRVRVPAGTTVDLGATAKGWAADRCAAAAAAATGAGVLVSLGGDVAVAGALPADGWPVGVADASDPSLPVGASTDVVVLRGGGLATSSTTARRWRRGGFELHHLVDPRTGLPSRGPWRTVTVAAESCVLANTAATASIVMGHAAPRWLAECDLDARLVATDGTVTLTGRWPRGIQGGRP